MIKICYDNKKKIEKIEKIIQKKRKKKKINFKNSKGIFIYGDNFDGMIGLLENFENKIDLIYIDPPFNTNSNFYYNEKKTSTISVSKDDIIAYSDKMNFEDYLEFIRERLVLIKMLLSDKGTLYFHIDCKVGHYIKIILDEIFGADNFINDITRIKGNPKNFKRKAYGNQKDLVLFYAKNKGKHIFNDITEPLELEEIEKRFNKIDIDGRRYNTIPLHAPEESQGETGGEFLGILPPEGRHWRTSPKVLEKLNEEGLIEWSKNGVPRLKKFADEHKGKKIQDVWKNYKDSQQPIYPTEKNYEMLSMIIKQSSNENSIIMDCFCGSSSFLSAGIENNRYVIGIDKSKIAKDIIKNKRKNLKDIFIVDLL